MSVSEWVHDPLRRPVVMGIVNVTPDSFSDGGQFICKNKAIDYAAYLLDEGADILDIGGESTRPGSQAVGIQEEIDRVIPVIEVLADRGACVSVDTRNAATMRAAIRAGAKIINDISALEHDSESIGVLAAAPSAVGVVLMHMRGKPETMQDNPFYSNVVEDVYDYLSQRVQQCAAAGITKDRILIDPGIGFGKTLEHNLLLQRSISRFSDLGCAVLLGTSRKRFIAELSRGEDASMRLGGSLASVIWARSQGVRFFRVHDVAPTRQALKVYDAMLSTSAS